MQRLEDNLYFYLMRSVAVLLMVYVTTGFAIFGERPDFTHLGTGTTLLALLMVLFCILYTVEQVAIYFENKKWMLRLFWITALVTAAMHLVSTEFGYVLTFVAFWVARSPHHFDFRTCSRLSFVALAYYLVMMYFRGDEDLETLLILAIVGPAVLFFVLTTAHNSINLQRERIKAVQLNRDLQAAQLLLAQSSRTGERLRIARDIHDLLGHQMTALVLNLEVASHKATDEALTHVQRSLALAKMLLSDLRNAVSDMRENPALDFDSALSELLANVPQLQVTLDRQPGFVVNDLHTAEVLLRCIQEALTNTLRHARATSCHIRLHVEHGEFVLDISDDGKSPLRITPGNGLKGMQERIAAMAGTLHWYRHNGSFRLRAQLPRAAVAS